MLSEKETQQSNQTKPIIIGPNAFQCWHEYDKTHWIWIAQKVSVCEWVCFCAQNAHHTIHSDTFGLYTTHTSGGNCGISVAAIVVAIHFYHCTFSDRNQTHKISLGCVYRSFSMCLSVSFSIPFRSMQLPYNSWCAMHCFILLHTKMAKTMHTHHTLAHATIPSIYENTSYIW